MSCGGFKTIVLNCDGPNGNKAAIRILTSDLQIYDRLLIFANICSARSINNSDKLGLRDYSYGSAIRNPRVSDSVRDSGVLPLDHRYFTQFGHIFDMGVVPRSSLPSEAHCVIIDEAHRCIVIDETQADSPLIVVHGEGDASDIGAQTKGEVSICTPPIPW